MPMLTNPAKSIKRTANNRGDFVGFVVDNVDPEKRQRVKIRIPQLHRNVPDEDLPWSLQDGGAGAPNVGGGAGGVKVPPMGSKLFVRMEENDPHNPRYGASLPTDDVNKDNELLKEDYPHTEGFVDVAGNRLAVNKEKQTVNFTHTSGTTVFIDAQGTVSVSAKSFQVGLEGDLVVAAKGKINLSGEGGINLNGRRIDLNSGGAPSAGARTARTRPAMPNVANKTSY